MYKPCDFDREKYLEHADKFEAISLDDAQEELTEHSDDAEGLAFELAYTRYALAKAEKVNIELNEETRFILGRPNFWCGSIAPLFRKVGHEIPNKAEEEQAYVIHWMLGLYAEHGSGYKAKANEFLQAAAKADNPHTE